METKDLLLSMKITLCIYKAANRNIQSSEIILWKISLGTFCNFAVQPIAPLVAMFGNK